VLDKKDSNSWLMLILGVGNAKAGALVISGGAQGDDLALLNLLERVSYAGVIFLIMMCLIFLGIGPDKVSNC
jgi:succinylglutamate desuccinylase